eukprot:CAMPEP_0201886698 /NCGR_PEP_ID=MMETSP0902-20130614/22840_1 /ASSEMBLY_ACC=CAM_ASM_000551 /TAXON_ID=420261 /ORGANISM="Thalassiosira antarctica, Strain CCMP982" /LENGTH=139 /DNA_ID=CAMNT_0048416355 /DNA_START=9 /DNA_END=425 /DNA_ORIENTATION=+
MTQATKSTLIAPPHPFAISPQPPPPKQAPVASAETATRKKITLSAAARKIQCETASRLAKPHFSPQPPKNPHPPPTKTGTSSSAKTIARPATIRHSPRQKNPAPKPPIPSKNSVSTGTENPPPGTGSSTEIATRRAKIP